MGNIGKLLVMVGALLMAVGIVIWSGVKYFHWFGHLPGDIRIERDNFKFYMPLASMLLVSVVFSLVLWIVRKLM